MDPRSFHGAPVARDPRRRFVEALAIAILVVFVGAMMAKPWDLRAAPGGPTAAPTGAPPTAAPALAGFTLPAPPPPDAPWIGVFWRRLAPGDPLASVTSMIRWRDGFIALGSGSPGAPASTPVWTSPDGVAWEPLPIGAAATFAPGTLVVGIAEVPDGLVALAERGPDGCGDLLCARSYAPPITPWTSPDGGSWTPHDPFTLGPVGGAEAARLVLAAGPTGLVAASTDPATRLATSRDGVTWQVLPAGTLPAGFVLADLRDTPNGFVAGGRRTTGDGPAIAATLSSADGRTWSPSSGMPSPAGPTGSGITALVAGSDGLVAVDEDGQTGIGGAAPRAGAARWWQSPNGRAWRMLPAFPPLGAISCPAGACGGAPDGAIAGDGARMVALRGGSRAGAWTSSAGRAWQPLSVTLNLPAGQAGEPVVLPGGVLVTVGGARWFGAAVGP